MSTRVRPSPLTVRELVELYCTFRLPELDPRSQTLSRRYLSVYVQDFGSSLVSTLNKRELIAWLRRQDCWPAPSTKKTCLNRVKAVFGWALREDDLIDKNPYAALSWEESPQRRSLRDDEYAAAWACAPPIFRRLLWFLHATGCRPGEAARLEWSMIDWAESVAVLQKHKTAKKTGKPRILYLSAEAVQFLRMLEAGPRHRKQGERVFANARGSRWTSCQMSTYWGAIREKAKLPQDALLYGLRHRAATILALTEPAAIVSEACGHTSIQTTMRYYVHTSEHRGAVLKAMAKVNGQRLQLF